MNTISIEEMRELYKAARDGGIAGKTEHSFKLSGKAHRFVITDTTVSHYISGRKSAVAMRPAPGDYVAPDGTIWTESEVQWGRKIRVRGSSTVTTVRIAAEYLPEALAHFGLADWRR